MADYIGLTRELVTLLSAQKGVAGRLGYKVDGVWQVVDQDDPTKYYVRFPGGTSVSAYHRNQVQQKPDLPVRVGLDSQHRPTILGVDADLIDHFSGESGVTVGPHDHVRNSGREFVIDTWMLKQLRVSVVSAFVVKVASGPYLFNGRLRQWQEDTIDLAAYVPDFGFQRWVVLAIDPESESLIVFPGEIVYGDQPMAMADLADIDDISINYISLAEIWLNGGASQIYNYQIEDLRYMGGEMVAFLTDLADVSSVSGYYGYALKWDGDEWTPEPTIPRSTATLSDPPQPEEIDAAFGIAGQATGFVGHIDSGGTGDSYRLFVRDQDVWVMYNGVAIVALPTITAPAADGTYTPDTTPTFTWE